MRYSIFFLLFSFFSFTISSQNDWCATDEMLEQYLNESPANRATFEAQEEELLNLIKNQKVNKSSHKTIIPVVVHVIHNNGVGNISKAQIEDGLRILNEDLQLLNADTNQIRTVFDPYKANFEIEFRLAQKDPNGVCTEGITRTNSPLSNSAQPRNSVKAVSNWNPNKYYNIWLVNSISSSGSGTTLGYAQFPNTGSANTFGIVCRNDEWGSIGTAVGSNGRTVTHEVGHTLMLYHTFQGGCGNDCFSTGDGVCDTPPAAQSTFGCNLANNSCSNDASGFSPYNTNVPDMLENYMSYDDCQYMFTKGQKARAQAALNNYAVLSNLHTQTNLIATGTNDGYIKQTCSPVAHVNSNKIFSCVGENITFSEDSYNGPVTSWNWSFPGGTPSSSTDSMPTVVYAIPGKYNYSVTVSNSGGSDNLTKNNEVIVSDTIGMNSFNYLESFESTSQFLTDWTVIDRGGNAAWNKINNVSYAGNSSVWINNFNGNTKGEKDALVSPSFDLSTVTNPTMKFNVAYKKVDAGSNDVLAIHYSTNCGENWNLLYNAGAFLIHTGNNLASYFTPQFTNDWKEISLPFPPNIKFQKNIKFKFEFTSGGGNNLYMDNIRIEGPAYTGIESQKIEEFLYVYPNPTSSNFNIEIMLEKQEKVSIVLKDLMGKTVKNIADNTFSANQYKFSANTNDLTSGIYMVDFTIGSKRYVKKLVVR